MRYLQVKSPTENIKTNSSSSAEDSFCDETVEAFCINCSFSFVEFKTKAPCNPCCRKWNQNISVKRTLVVGELSRTMPLLTWMLRLFFEVRSCVMPSKSSHHQLLWNPGVTKHLEDRQLEGKLNLTGWVMSCTCHWTGLELYMSCALAMLDVWAGKCAGKQYQRSGTSNRTDIEKKLHRLPLQLPWDTTPPPAPTPKIRRGLNICTGGGGLRRCRATATMFGLAPVSSSAGTFCPAPIISSVEEVSSPGR